MSERPDFDLQAHSTCSDGSFGPAAVVAWAGAAGVRLLALTDHDTLEGVAEAVAAGPAHGVTVVAGCEISALTTAGEDRHILGYLVDPADAALQAELAASRAERGRRADRMLAAVAELGFAVDAAGIDALRAAGRPIGRPHLAAGVVDHPANRARLTAEGCAEANAFLDAYLTPGRPAYRTRGGPTIARAIELIHGAGGVAVWAHPFWEMSVPHAVLAALDEFVGFGLDGVEAFYITHDAAQTRLLHDRAGELDLLITGSADFHGPEHARFSKFLAFSLHGLAPRLGAIDAQASAIR